MNNNIFTRWLALSFAIIALFGCSSNKTHVLTKQLEHFVSDKDARIGIAVIIDGKDTIEVNGKRDFPMLSVFKFPQALAVADFCNRFNIEFDDSISVSADEIKTDTWSPMRERYGKRDMKTTVSELLEFSVSESDNNACDILFRLTGGTQYTDSLMKARGFNDINIAATEDDMHKDIYLSYLNRSTPIEMARLADLFNSSLKSEDRKSGYIAELMEHCKTGGDRLKKPLPDNVTIGHKTGTGDINLQGRLIGINDVGYVNMPDGRRYAIAVFIADASFDVDECSEIISEISQIVYQSLQ